jgi:hypothetical protein
MSLPSLTMTKPPRIAAYEGRDVVGLKRGGVAKLHRNAFRYLEDGLDGLRRAKLSLDDIASGRVPRMSTDDRVELRDDLGDLRELVEELLRVAVAAENAVFRGEFSDVPGA